MIHLYKNVTHGAFRHGNVGGRLRRIVSVRLAKALALGDVAKLAHGRSRLYFRLGSFHEEYLGVLCFYEVLQHFNEPRTRHLCGKPIVPAPRPASCSVQPHHSYRCSRSASALQRTSCDHPRTYRDFSIILSQERLRRIKRRYIASPSARWCVSTFHADITSSRGHLFACARHARSRRPSIRDRCIWI